MEEKLGQGRRNRSIPSFPCQVSWCSRYFTRLRGYSSEQDWQNPWHLSNEQRIPESNPYLTSNQINMAYSYHLSPTWLCVVTVYMFTLCLPRREYHLAWRMTELRPGFQYSPIFYWLTSDKITMFLPSVIWILYTQCWTAEMTRHPCLIPDLSRKAANVFSLGYFFLSLLLCLMWVS